MHLAMMLNQFSRYLSLLFFLPVRDCVWMALVSERASARAHTHIRLRPSASRYLVLNISCPTVGTEGRCKKIFNWFVMCFLFLWLHYDVVFFFFFFFRFSLLCCCVFDFTIDSVSALYVCAVWIFALSTFLVCACFLFRRFSLRLIFLRFIIGFWCSLKWLLPLLVETWNQNRKMPRIIVSFSLRCGWVLFFCQFIGRFFFSNST